VRVRSAVGAQTTLQPCSSSRNGTAARTGHCIWCAGVIGELTTTRIDNVRAMQDDIHETARTGITYLFSCVGGFGRGYHQRCAGMCAHARVHTFTFLLLQVHARFPCAQCSMGFVKERHYLEHSIDMHNEPQPYKCMQCNKQFGTRARMRKHRNTHKIYRFVCNVIMRA
jgi:uncharacterized Zn-finger protein